MERWLSENEMGSEEIFDDGSGGGYGEDWEPKEEALSRDSKGMLKPIEHQGQWSVATQEAWESCLHPTLSKRNEFNCCQQAGIQRSSQLGGNRKRGYLQTTVIGEVNLQALTISHACAFPLPKLSNLDGFPYLVSFLPISNSGKKGKPFAMWDFAFPSTVPLGT